MFVQTWLRYPGLTFFLKSIRTSSIAANPASCESWCSLGVQCSGGGKNIKASRRCWTLDFWCWLRVHVCVLLTGNFPPCHTEVGSIDSVFIQGEAGRVTFPPNTAKRHLCHKHLRRTGLIKRHTWHAFRGRRFSSFHSSVQRLTSYNWTYFRHLLGWSECTVQDFILQYCKNRVCTSSNEL